MRNHEKERALMATPYVQDLVNSMPLPSEQQLDRLASLLHASATRAQKPVDLQEHIDKAVAAAPEPTPEQIKELGRLLAPALLSGKGKTHRANDSQGETMTTKNLVTLADAAAHYKVNPRTLRRRIADGTLSHYRFGNRIRIDLTEADAIFRC